MPPEVPPDIYVDPNNLADYNQKQIEIATNQRNRQLAAKELGINEKELTDSQMLEWFVDKKGAEQFRQMAEENYANHH